MKFATSMKNVPEGIRGKLKKERETDKNKEKI